jgi:hypothetical protein
MFVNCHTILQVLLAVIFAANRVQTKLELTQFLDDVTQLSGHQTILNGTDHGKVLHFCLKNSPSCNITHILLNLKRIHSLIKSDFIIKQNYVHCHEGSTCTHTQNRNVFINWFNSETALFEYYKWLLYLTDLISYHFCKHLLLFIY